MGDARAPRSGWVTSVAFDPMDARHRLRHLRQLRRAARLSQQRWRRRRGRRSTARAIARCPTSRAQPGRRSRRSRTVLPRHRSRRLRVSRWRRDAGWWRKPASARSVTEWLALVRDTSGRKRLFAFTHGRGAGALTSGSALQLAERLARRGKRFRTPLHFLMRLVQRRARALHGCFGLADGFACAARARCRSSSAASRSPPLRSIRLARSFIRRRSCDTGLTARPAKPASAANPRGLSGRDETPRRFRCRQRFERLGHGRHRRWRGGIASLVRRRRTVSLAALTASRCIFSACANVGWLAGQVVAMLFPQRLSRLDEPVVGGSLVPKQLVHAPCRRTGLLERLDVPAGLAEPLRERVPGCGELVQRFLIQAVDF